MQIEECRIIVTGAASGLGEACVRNPAEGGAPVAIFDLAVEKGETLVLDCKSERNKFAFVTPAEFLSRGPEVFLRWQEAWIPA